MLYIPAPWIRHGILIMPEFNGIFVNIMVSAPPRTSASQLQGRGGCQALDVANPAGP